jgi:hypothetical protein
VWKGSQPLQSAATGGAGAKIDRVASGSSWNATVVSDAYAAARELLQRAEEEAAKLRTEADRYVRQREQEAALLVAKARRVLAVAEERAAVLDAAAGRAGPGPRSAATDPAARWPAPEPSVPAPRAVPTPAEVASPIAIDLDEMAADDELEPPPEQRRVSSGIDRILADAIAKAMDRSFPADP